MTTDDPRIVSLTADIERRGALRETIATALMFIFNNRHEAQVADEIATITDEDDCRMCRSVVQTLKNLLDDRLQEIQLRDHASATPYRGRPMGGDAEFERLVRGDDPEAGA